MSCEHSSGEKDTAVHFDGSCPICLKAQYDDLVERFDALCNDLWGLLYPGDPTSWEYPGQVVNHLRVELERRAK